MESDRRAGCGGRGSGHGERECGETCGHSSCCRGSCGHRLEGRGNREKRCHHRLVPVATGYLNTALNWECGGGHYLEMGFDNF